MFMQCQLHAVESRKRAHEKGDSIPRIPSVPSTRTVQDFYKPVNTEMRLVDKIIIAALFTGTSSCLGVLFAKAVLGIAIPNPLL